MKKLLSAVLGLIMCHHPAYGSNDFANLHIKMAGAKNNTYFLCVSNVGGCVSIFQADHGRSFPMNAGEVKHIFVFDARTLHMHTQPLPSSCNVNVDNNQTLTVTGKVVKAANDNVHVTNLQCSVA